MSAKQQKRWEEQNCDDLDDYADEEFAPRATLQEMH